MEEKLNHFDILKSSPKSRSVTAVPLTVEPPLLTPSRPQTLLTIRATIIGSLANLLTEDAGRGGTEGEGEPTYIPTKIKREILLIQHYIYILKYEWIKFMRHEDS